MTLEDRSLNPIQLAPEIAWQDNGQDRFFFEHKDRVEKSKTKITQLLSEAPAQLRFELVKVILRFQSEGELLRKGGASTPHGVSEELNAFLTPARSEALSLIQNEVITIIVPACMSTENFYLLSQDDRKNLIDILIQTNYEGLGLARLLTNLVPLGRQRITIGKVDAALRIIIPDVISPLSYVLTHHIFADEALIKEVASTGEDETLILILMGTIYGFFDDDIASLDIRRILTPYIIEYSQNSQFQTSFIENLLVDPLYDLDSSRLKQLKYFASSSLRDISTIRTQELPTPLSSAQIDALAARLVESEYGYPTDSLSLNDDEHQTQENLVNARKTAFFTHRARIAEQEQATFSFAESLRKDTLNKYDSRLKILVTQYEVTDEVSEKERAAFWFNNQYLKKILSPQFITNKSWQDEISKIVLTYRQQKKVHPEMSGEEILNTFMEGDSFSKTKSANLLQIYKQELAVNGRDKNHTPIANFLRQLETPTIFLTFLLALLEKAILLGGSSVNFNRKVLSEFEMMVRDVISHHSDAHASFEPQPRDVSAAETAKGFSSVEMRGLAQMANINPDSGFVGLNNPSLQSLFQERIAYARKFNAQIEKMGVSIRSQDKWHEYKALLYEYLPHIVFVLSALTFFAEVSKNDQASIDEFVSATAFLIPPLLTLLLFKVRPSMLQRKYFKPNFLEPGVEKNSRAWENQVEKLRLERKSKLDFYYNTFLIWTLFLFASGGFLATDIDVRIRDSIKESISGLSAPVPDELGIASEPATDTESEEQPMISPLGELDGRGSLDSNSSNFSSDLRPMNEAKYTTVEKEETPRFKVHYKGQFPPIFWVRGGLDQGRTPTDSAPLPSGAYEEDSPVYKDYFQAEVEFEAAIDRYFDSGYLIRENTDISDGTFEFPEGFRLDRILILNGNGVQNDIGRGQGYNFSGISFTGQAERVALVFSERLDPSTFGDASKLRFKATESVITDAESSAFSEDSRLEELITMAKGMKESGISPSVALRRLKYQLEVWGIKYGFSDFDSNDFSTHIELGEALLKQFKLICNQFSWILTLAMKEGGYENVFLARGYASYNPEGYGGFPSDAHQVIVYQEGDYLYLFDATLPDASQLEALGELTVEEREAYILENDQVPNSFFALFEVIATGLVGVGAPSFVGWYVLRKRRRGRARQKQEQQQGQQDQSDESQTQDELVSSPDADSIKTTESVVESKLIVIDQEQKIKAANIVFETFYSVVNFYRIEGGEIWNTPSKLAQDIAVRVSSGNFSLIARTLALGSQIREALVADTELSVDELNTFIRSSGDRMMNVSERKLKILEGLKVVVSTFMSDAQSREPMMQEIIQMLTKVISTLENQEDAVA